MIPAHKSIAISRTQSEEQVYLTYSLSLLLTVVESSVQGRHARVPPAVLKDDVVGFDPELPPLVREEQVTFVLHVCLLQVHHRPLTVYYAAWRGDFYRIK